MGVSPDDVRRRAEIDRLVSLSNVHRLRGELLEAEDACRKAIELDESDASLRELLGDVLYARGQLESARDEFKKALDIDPLRVSAETKFAKVVLEIGEKEYGKKIALEMIENPSKFQTSHSPLAAFILSITPGLGQIYLGEYVRGGIILGVFTFSLLMLSLAKEDLKATLRALGSIFRPVSEPGVPLGGIAIVFLSIIVFLYIYAVIDVAVTASKPKVSNKDKEGTDDRENVLIEQMKEELKSKKLEEREQEGERKD